MNEEVIVRFGGETTAFDRAMRGMVGAAKNIGKEIGSLFAEPFKMLAAPLSIAGLVEVLRKVGEKAKEINAGMATTGLGAESFQRLTFAAREINGGVEAATSGLTKLNLKIGESRSGVESATSAFTKWGITIAGKDNEQIISEIANSMKDMADPSQRVAMAVDLMGKGGAAMVPFLQQGADAIKEMESHAAIFTADDLENIRKANEEISMWGNQILVWLGQSLGAVKELGKEWGGFLGLRSNKEFSVGDDGKVHETTEKDRRRKADADALAAHKDNLSNEAAASKQQYDRDMEAYNKYVEWKRGRGMEGMGGRQKITNLYVAIQQEEDAAKAETVYQKKIEHWKKITELQGKLAGEEKSLAEKQRSEQEKYNSLKEREMSIRAEILRKENDVGAFDLKDLAKRAAFKNATHQKLSTNEKNALEARHEFDALEESRASGDAVGVKLHEGKYLGLVGGNDALKSGERDPAGKSERHLEKIQTDMAKLAAACSAQGIKIDTGETQ